MRIVIVDESVSPEVTEETLTKIAQAIEHQLYQHYGPFWQMDGVPVRFLDSIGEAKESDCPLIIFDNPDQPGVLGYHSVTPNGLAYGKAFYDVIRRQFMEGPVNESNTLSVTLSHEALEMVGDPYTNCWVDCSFDEEEAFEICDRVEGDSYKIDIDGTPISVSNFLGPRAFRDGIGPYDYMGLLSSPWEIRPYGYVIRRKGGPSGVVSSHFGHAYPEAKQLLKISHGRALQKRASRLEILSDESKDS